MSPAGDRESLEAALRFGADAVYMGGPMLQLRSEKAAFSEESLAQAVSCAHSLGKKVYVTVNSFAVNDEIALCGDYARLLQGLGADAAIISDIGVLAEFRRAAPDLECHISTQANCQNYAAARVYYEMGARRIVLAREMTLDEIRRLRDNTPPDLELEAFVHGAMCMAYSGRCILSSFLNDRSGNRGECSQPCRWNYALTEEKRPGEYFPIEENDGFTTILSSHDLCCIEHLDELAAAGVSSFKIEGRMKTAYYVATVTGAYRRAMDGTASMDDCIREVLSLKHRPYSTGFYYGQVREHHNNSGRYSKDCTFIANVLGREGDCLVLRQRNRFCVGDTLEALSPNVSGSFTVTEIRTPEGESRQAAPHPNETLLVPCSLDLQPGDFLRRRE